MPHYVPKKRAINVPRLHILLCGFLLSNLLVPIRASAQLSEGYGAGDSFMRAADQRDLVDTELAQWHVRQADRYRAASEYLKALMHAERALTIDPSDEEVEDLIDELRDAYDDKMKRLAKVTKNVQKALEAEDNGKIDKALRYWKRAKNLAEGDARVERGYQEFLNRFDSAIPSLVRATEIATSDSTKTQVNEYLVSNGDVLEIFVWQQPDLSRNVIVRPDGRISFPLAGDLIAAGKTLVEVDRALTERLKAYIRFPDVSLAIRRFGGTKTIVMGEVGSPGIYVPTGEGSVLEVIAMAGGFKPSASQNDVLLIRGGLQKPQIAKLQLEDVLRKGALDQNIRVASDDIIYVPKQEVKDVMAWVEQFFPILSGVLVTQSIATNFGTYETSGAAAAR